MKSMMIVLALLIPLHLHAETSVKGASEKLQVDLAILDADIASNKDKAILSADKARVKQDKSALKSARRAEKERPWQQP